MRCIVGRWKLDLTNNRPQSWVNIDILTTIAERWFHWLAILSSLCQWTVDIVSTFECEESWGDSRWWPGTTRKLSLPGPCQRHNGHSLHSLVSYLYSRTQPPSPPGVDSIIGIYNGKTNSLVRTVFPSMFEEGTGGINTVSPLQEAPLRTKILDKLLLFIKHNLCLSLPGEDVCNP